MNFSNKLLIKIAYLSLVVIFVGLVGFGISHPQLSKFLPVGGILFMMSSGYLLVKNGSFIKTREYLLIRLAIALVLLGVLFMLMHWDYGFDITILGYASFPIIYLVYMIRHRYFDLDKILKLILLLSLIIGRILRMEHLPYWQHCGALSLLVSGYLFIDFIRNKYVKE